MIHNPALPRVMGVFLSVSRVCYEDAVTDQIGKARAKKGKGDLQTLLNGEETWTIS
jgi:hypothetical protein